MKIEKLTPEQENQLIEFRETWRKTGLSTDRVDKPKTIEAITEMYSLINKKPPIFIFCPSLLFAQYQIAFCKTLFKDMEKRANLGDNLGDNLRANLGDNLRANLSTNLSTNLWANLGDNLSTNLGDNLWANLRANLWANLSTNLSTNLRANLQANLQANLWANLSTNLGAKDWANLQANLQANLGANLGDNLQANLGANLGANICYESTNFWGSMDAYWIAFYEFPEKFLGIRYAIEQKRKLELWSVLAKSTSWFWCYENYCFVSDRPDFLSFDANNRLHNNSRTAVSFIDGYEIYYWHGVSVPAQWICFPETVTREDIVKEGNAEKRRCLMEILGETRYAELLDLIEIDRDKYNGRHIHLFRTKDKDNLIDDFIYFIKVICPSTARKYYICVPKHTDVLSALSWTFGMDKSEYKLSIET